MQYYWRLCESVAFRSYGQVARRMAVSGGAQTRGGVEIGSTDAMSAARDRIITPRTIQFPFFLNDYAERKLYSGGGAEAVIHRDCAGVNAQVQWPQTTVHRHRLRTLVRAERQ